MRLKEDSTSWKSRSIMRRDFRHDPGLPETEIPRHKKSGKNKKKHVHEYEKVRIGKEIRREHRRLPEGGWTTVPREVDKYIYVCKRCGNKTSYYAGVGYYW